MFPIRDSIPTVHPAVMTRLLIVATSIVFVFELALSRPAVESLFYLFGIVPARFTHPEWAVRIGLPIHEYWPFLTSMFLHAGWLHVIGNLWTLWIFGDNVEDRMGPVRFLLFYLLCGVVSGLVHWFASPDATVPTVGASGAIAGVLGAYFILFPTSRVIVLLPIFFWPFFFELPAVAFLLFWFLVQFFSGTLAVAGPAQVGGIAWWAHVGGFVAGVLLHRFFLSRTGREAHPDELGFLAAWGGRATGRRA